MSSGLFGGFESVVLENDAVRCVVLPELGGKMASLVRLASGTEFLLPPPNGARGYRR